MIELLYKVEDSLIDLLFKNAANIKTMYIDYHKPYVSRIWFLDKESNCRVFLHKIEPCQGKEGKEALYHPHPWDSAIRLIAGEYEMGIGHSETNEIPKTDCTLILYPPTCYEMTEIHGWHYVAPKTDTYTLMVIPNKLNGREVPLEPNKKFRKLTKKEVQQILYTFREHCEKYRKLDVRSLADLITDVEVEIEVKEEVSNLKIVSKNENEFDRGDKVNFKGNSEFKPVKGTYIWAVGVHMGILYYIQHPDGNMTKQTIANNGGLPDGFETPHSKNFQEGLRYICVTGEELELVEKKKK